MRLHGWVLIATLSACRLGFDDAPTSVTVSVTQEEGEPSPGAPVGNVDVVVIDGAITTRLVTDASGSVAFEVTADAAVQIVRPSMQVMGDWLVYSFEHVRGSLRVGGHEQAGASLAMTINLPTVAGVDTYWVAGPMRCITSMGAGSSTAVALTFSPDCAGETLPLYAFAATGGTMSSFISLGEVTLAGGTSLTANGWLPSASYEVDYETMPSWVTTIDGQLAWPCADCNDATPIDGFSVMPTSGAAWATLGGPPIGDRASLATVFSTADSASHQFAFQTIVGVTGPLAFDAAQLLPPIVSPAIDDAQHAVSWQFAGVPDGATVAAVHAQIGNVAWSAYGFGSTTSLTFPELPDDLTVATPRTGQAWNVEVGAYRLSDLDYEQALEVVDIDGGYWVDQGAYLPSGSISYTYADLTMGPPPSGGGVDQGPGHHHDGSSGGHTSGFGHNGGGGGHPGGGGHSGHGSGGGGHGHGH